MPRTVPGPGERALTCPWPDSNTPPRPELHTESFKGFGTVHNLRQSIPTSKGLYHVKRQEFHFQHERPIVLRRHRSNRKQQGHGSDGFLLVVAVGDADAAHVSGKVGPPGSLSSSSCVIHSIQNPRNNYMSPCFIWHQNLASVVQDMNQYSHLKGLVGVVACDFASLIYSRHNQCSPLPLGLSSVDSLSNLFGFGI